MLIIGIDDGNQVRCCEEGFRCSYTHEGRAIFLKDDCPALFFTYMQDAGASPRETSAKALRNAGMSTRIAQKQSRNYVSSLF